MKKNKVDYPVYYENHKIHIEVSPNRRICANTSVAEMNSLKDFIGSCTKKINQTNKVKAYM
jgi:hypothetical protein